MNRLPLFAFLSVLAVFQAQAGSTYKQDIPDTIPEKVRDMVKEAISKAYTRLFSDNDVIECIDKNAKIDYLDTETVEEHHGKGVVGKIKLFKIQLDIMRQHVKNGAELPPIKIVIRNEDSFAYAWGNYGLVHTSEKPEEKKVFWHGGFVVQLNSDKFLSGDSSDVWAGVIAHEMLHNLMHAHEDSRKVGIEKAYSDKVLINAAGNCVTNVKDRRDYSGTYRCGGRTK